FGSDAAGPSPASSPGGGGATSSTGALAAAMPGARASIDQAPSDMPAGTVIVVSKCPFGASSTVATITAVDPGPTRTRSIGPVDGTSPRTCRPAPGHDRG